MFKTSATVTLQYDTGFSPFAASEFAQALAWLADRGFTGAEICVADPRPVDAAGLKAQLDGLGLKVPTLSTGQARGLEGLSLTDADPQVRRRTVQRVKDHVDFAGRLGCPLVTIGLLRGLGQAGRQEDDLRLLAATLDECAGYAGSQDVKLALEPINRYETQLLNGVRETLALIAGLDSGQHVGVLFDTFHANIEEPDIGESLALLGNKLLHVHFADSNRWLPGDGHIDFTAVCRSLRLMGFRGYVSLETLNKPDRNYIRENGFVRLTRYMDGQ